MLEDSQVSATRRGGDIRSTGKLEDSLARGTRRGRSWAHGWEGSGHTEGKVVGTLMSYNIASRDYQGGQRWPYVDEYSNMGMI